MSYIGDFTKGLTYNFLFRTRDDTGAPATLSGSPSLAIYSVAGGTTEITAGITLTVDYDGVTGLNHVAIATSNAAYTGGGLYYDVAIAAGTVDSISVVGEVVGRFSIGHALEQAGAAVASANLATAANLATVDTVADQIKALLDDARTEPGQGALPVNPDLATKVDYLYKFLRNRSTQTASEFAVYADDGTTKDHAATVSDNGTTFDRGEIGTGA